ncbi:MAG: calcium/sodium antiporter [Campylobacteraceae bacterium]|nr:calcium/sodium antiporter [Campylobacteraceae bacterium]
MFGFSIAIIAGIALLVWSADRFVEGAAITAKYLGMPAFLIGMVVVGFGTSAPEMIVSAMAAWDGNPALALGNAVGSNIVNITLILGVTAVIAPIVVNEQILKKELPVLLVITLMSGFFFWDGRLTRFEGIVLFLSLIAIMIFAVVVAMRKKYKVLENQENFINKEMSQALALVWLSVGLLVLMASSRLLVWGAVGLAQTFGVSDLIIGLTIVALGTSLPELAASVVAARKGEHDIALGNIVGSNIFNILGVVGIAGIIAPMENITPELMSRDWLVMVGVTLLLVALSYGWLGKKGRIALTGGFLLLGSYILYNGLLLKEILWS